MEGVSVMIKEKRFCEERLEALEEAKKAAYDLAYKTGEPHFANETYKLVKQKLFCQRCLAAKQTESQK